MSLCPNNDICVSMWMMMKQIEIISIHSVRVATPWLHTEMCQISKSASLLRNTLTGLHKVGKRCRFCLWFLPPDYLFYTIPLRKSNAILSPYLQSKCRGCAKFCWRTKFVMTGCHVYLSSPKMSLDFWGKMVGITFETLFEEFRQCGLIIVLCWLRFDLPSSRGAFPGSYFVARLSYMCWPNNYLWPNSYLWLLTSEQPLQFLHSHRLSLLADKIADWLLYSSSQCKPI